MSYSRRYSDFDLSMIEDYNRRTPYPTPYSGASSRPSTGYSGYAPPPGYSHYGSYAAQPSSSYYGPPSSYATPASSYYAATAPHASSSRSQYDASSSSGHYDPHTRSFYDSVPVRDSQPSGYGHRNVSRRTHVAPQHNQSFLDPERRFPCPEPGCGRRFLEHGIMARHHAQSHARETLYRCQYCASEGILKEYTRNGSLYRHIRQAHDR